MIIAALFKAKMDHIAHTKGDNWKQKWKLNELGSLIPCHFKPKYYFKLYKPDYVEGFPYSSTILVFLTSKWHLYQFVMLRFFYFAIVINMANNLWGKLLLSLIVFPILFSVIFELYYKKLKKNG